MKFHRTNAASLSLIMFRDSAAELCLQALLQEMDRHEEDEDDPIGSDSIDPACDLHFLVFNGR